MGKSPATKHEEDHLFNEKSTRVTILSRFVFVAMFWRLFVQRFPNYKQTHVWESPVEFILLSHPSGDEVMPQRVGLGSIINSG